MVNTQKSEAAAIATMMTFSALLSVLIKRGLVGRTEFDEAMAQLVTWTDPATELGWGVRAYVQAVSNPKCNRAA